MYDLFLNLANKAELSQRTITDLTLTQTKNILHAFCILNHHSLASFLFEKQTEAQTPAQS